MNNGEIFNVTEDKPLDLDAIAKAHWMAIPIPYAKGKSKRTFLNVAQISRIEITEGVIARSECRICPKCGDMMILCEDKRTYYRIWKCEGCRYKVED